MDKVETEKSPSLEFPFVPFVPLFPSSLLLKTENRKLKTEMRVMAIDYGTKSIGIAISDELQLTIRPLTTIRRERKKYREVIDLFCSLVNENEIDTLVVGLPLNMDGTRGEASARTERFIADLKNRLSIPIITIDERLTSYEADQILREMGVDERERRLRSDEYAAMIILQDYLDGKASRGETENPSPQSSQ
jgi:putative Holliday junction resolvase